jgi:hypothetical protein
MTYRHTRDKRSDEGSALILVLVLMIIGAMIVLPLMSHIMAVGRANTVLSVKTARTEAVKAGLRMAMAEPTRLYDACGPAGATSSVALTTTGMSVPVKTECFKIREGFSLDTAQVRYGLAAVQKGQSVPPGMLSTGYVSPDPASTSAWQADTSLKSLTNKVWMPDLPVHGLSPRAPGGWLMPTPTFPACKVYFPGTYKNPVTISGPTPTYFASGIYYFESTLTIGAGADVVVGGGVVEGCTNDQNAAFYSVNAPSTHNINGLGGTFVFGGAGRLVVSNLAGTVKVQFNKRYVPAKDPGVAPSADVSIMSVNGQLGADGVTGENLLIPDVLEVPLSHVGEEVPAFPVTVPPGPPIAPKPATAQEYLPSTLVPGPAPTVPDPPTALVVTGYTNSVRVSWTAPVNTGGTPITGYTVRVATPAGNIAKCDTLSTTMCVVGGLVAATNYTFTVEAKNAVGTSALSVPSAVVQTGATAPPAWSPGTLPVVPPVVATPIIDFDLTTANAVTVNVPGYVSIPQGRLRVNNPNQLAVTLNGGVLAASFDITDLRAPVPIGLTNPIVQRTLRIVTQTTGGSPHVTGSAILQVNQGGAWAVNSWEVQAD